MGVSILVRLNYSQFIFTPTSARGFVVSWFRLSSIPRSARICCSPSFSVQFILFIRVHCSCAVFSYHLCCRCSHVVAPFLCFRTVLVLSHSSRVVAFVSCGFNSLFTASSGLVAFAQSCSLRSCVDSPLSQVPLHVLPRHFPTISD